MKRILACLLILMLFAISAFAEEVWYANSILQNEKSYNLADLDVEIAFHMNDDGTCSYETSLEEQKTFEGTYTIEGDAIEVTLTGFSHMTGTIEEDAIHLKDAYAELTFLRTKPTSTPLPTEVKATSIEEFDGVWNTVSVFAGALVDIDTFKSMTNAESECFEVHIENGVSDNFGNGEVEMTLENGRLVYDEFYYVYLTDSGLAFVFGDMVFYCEKIEA